MPLTLVSCRVSPPEAELNEVTQSHRIVRIFPSCASMEADKEEKLHFRPEAMPLQRWMDLNG
jgi:hypothetical protein